MAPDKLQQAWQAHLSETRVTVDADLLLKQVESEQRSFSHQTFWGDLASITTCLMLLGYWFWQGRTLASPWTFYLMVPVLIWHIVFTVMYRLYSRQQFDQSGTPLVSAVEASLSQLDAETWFYRNFFWWELLPMGIAMGAFLIHVELLKHHDHWTEALDALGTFAVVAGTFAFVYYQVRYSVRTRYEPKRDALLKLLHSLKDDPGDGAPEKVTVSVTSLSASKPGETYPGGRKMSAGMMVSFVTAMALMLLGMGLFVTSDINALTGGLPRRSPFAAVRWEGQSPLVKLEDEWFRLISLDDIPASDIVEFSQSTYGDIWQKRFEEDLVELLIAMQHPPEDRVKLVVESTLTSETQVRENVRMTWANRPRDS